MASRERLVSKVSMKSFAVVAVAVVLVAAFAARSQPRTDHPNILIIQADDLGYGDPSAYGQARFQTPSLDRLAREGIRFTQYHAGSRSAPRRARRS